MKKKMLKLIWFLVKTISNDSDKLLSNGDFVENDKTYIADFEIKESNNWIITGSFVVDGITGYLYIKTNAI